MSDATERGGDHRKRRDAAFCLVAVALSTGLASTALIASRRFFFTDDYVTYFLPGFREIGRLLARGQLPLLTDRIWIGGDLLQEYQFAVFNPVCLALYWLISRFNDLAAAAAIFSLVHIAIFAAGAYALARVVGCASRHALLVGVFAPLGDWIFYWAAANWIGALVSMAWLVWAWALLVLAARRAAWAPAAALAVAMVLVSGWPFANLALLISLIAAGGATVAIGGRWPMGPTVRVVFSLGAGALVAAPAILPVYLYLHHAIHSPDPGLWAVGLDGLLGVGVPDFVTHWRTQLVDYQTVRLPTTYVAWFAPIALVNANWSKLWRSPTGAVLILSAALFASLSMDPGFWQFRWMFRLLPYYQTAVLVLAAFVLTQADRTRIGWKLAPTAIVVAAEIWLAISEDAASRVFYVCVGAGLALAAWAGARVIRRGDHRWTALAVAAGAAAFELTVWHTVGIGYPQAPNAWKPATASALPPSETISGPTRYAIFRHFEAGDPGPKVWAAFAPGNTALEQTGASAQGYSPILRPEISDRLCGGHFGTECGDVIHRMTAPVAPTTAGLIDLMGIGEVAIEQPGDAAAFRAWASGRWREARGEAGEWRFDRMAPTNLISWTTPGASGEARSTSPTQIVGEVRNIAASTGTLVFSRAWYPSWRASLNGKTIDTQPLAGFLLSVRLPPGSHGRLELSFWPDGLASGLVLALVGGLMIVIGAARPSLIDKAIYFPQPPAPIRPRPGARTR